MNFFKSFMILAVVFVVVSAAMPSNAGDESQLENSEMKQMERANPCAQKGDKCHAFSEEKIRCCEGTLCKCTNGGWNCTCQ
ncbi:U4-agatoxin-Ao1a-like [Stegodyphus dumicola]|uniref:U4-agatoxin-Ao1a-like n=1 Tax=Stegodyphus dumicola TaxID=202533 RepID=UPI0015AE115A|nr:U4-agatoxin-Ao1a-like [Stegodyphus dumicola]